MKKLLLSSLMMFAVCSYVTAQNATDSKFKKAETTTTSVAPTPQKSAVTNDVVAPPATATDKANQAAVPAANDKAAKVRNAQPKPAEATAVSADGVVVSNNDLSPKEKEELKKDEELRKMEAAKAAAAKKNKEN